MRSDIQSWSILAILLCKPSCKCAGLMPVVTNGILIDLLSEASYERDGNGMLSPGLHMELALWNHHSFRCLPTGKNQD
jgi:hypothetical protein